MFFESLGEFHLDGTSSSNYFVSLETSSDDHDSIVKRSFGFLDKLFSSSSQNDSGWFSLNKDGSTLGQSSNKLYLSAPICFSWNDPQVPNTSGATLFTVVCKTAPVDLATLLISSLGTLPAQKIPLSANHWVAKSPMGSLERTIWAPTSSIFFSLS